MPNLYVDSNGNSPEFPRPYRTMEPKLARAQKKLSRKKPGSKRYEKQRMKVAKLYAKSKHQRKDVLHKLSCTLTDTYDLIAIEDLDMSAMKQALRFGKAAYEPHLKYMDLQLWSDYKFHHDVKFREYKKYENVRTICSELNEIWAYTDAEVRNEELSSDDISVIVHRFTAIASYTSAVLLRDFKETLSHEDQTLCESIIFSIGDLFAHASHFEIVQAGNGIDAVAVGLVLLSNEDNIKAANDGNPLYLLLKLALNDWSYNSRIANGIASTIWAHSQNAAWRFLYLFSLLADSYEDALLKNESFSSDDFFKQNEGVIARALTKDSVDITDLDFSKLQNMTIFTLLSLVSPQATEAFKFADATKALVMELVFTDNRDLRAERRELSGYTINYVSWLADVLLHCEQAEQAGLIDAFFQYADLTRNALTFLSISFHSCFSLLNFCHAQDLKLVCRQSEVIPDRCHQHGK